MKFIKEDGTVLADIQSGTPQWQTMRHTVWSKPFVICEVPGVWVSVAHDVPDGESPYSDGADIIVTPWSDSLDPHGTLKLGQPAEPRDSLPAKMPQPDRYRKFAVKFYQRGSGEAWLRAKCKTCGWHAEGSGMIDLTTVLRGHMNKACSA